MTTTTHYDDARDKVARIQRELDNTIRGIRENRRYTADARRIEMAKATLDARKKVAALRAAAVNARTAKRESIERSIFGATTSAEMAEIRAASAIAMKLDNDKEALEMLALAQQRGDTLMAKALAQVAARKGWVNTKNTWAEKAGDTTRRLLDQLTEIPEGRNTTAADSMVYRITSPIELASIREDSHLRFIAEGSDDTFFTNMEPGDRLGASANYG